MVGNRKGRFDGARPDSDFAGGSPTSMLFGLFLLWWGWIGFNCGSSFGISYDKWVVATRAGVNTINSSAAGGVVSMAYSLWYTKGKYLRPRDVVTGVLGALVSITPCCASVHTYIALVIGAIGSVVACAVNDWLMIKKLKLDDPVGAIGVHVGGAVWGLVAVGLFADSQLPGITVGDGLFYAGGLKQLGLQVLAIAVVCAWSFTIMFPFFWLVGVAYGGTWRNPRKGLRLNFEDAGDHQADPHLHDCLEDPTGKILSEVGTLLRSESETLLLGTASLGIDIPGSAIRSSIRNRSSRHNVVLLQSHLDETESVGSCESQSDDEESEASKEASA
jgi:ammonia channel protein AmtB